ncbi:uncharacterized protein [Parasteatoda tepidariorum]
MTKSWIKLLKLCILVELCSAVQTSFFGDKTLKGTLLSKPVLTIVRFLSIPCSSPNGQMSGVCYSLNDCVRMRGTQIGTCASGFGVCCIFQRTCGTATNQNSTHFVNPGYPEVIEETSDTTCTISLYRPPRVPICQVRLDFLEFDITKPTSGDCLDDQLTITGSNVNSPIPVLCGRNAGQHVYIDVDNSVGPVQLTVSTKGVGRRKWNIKSSFIECANPSRAPPNCLQYYTGPEGRFSSFNYVPGESSAQSGGYLNNQNYAICFRKETGRCSQTYTADSIESFILLNLNSNNSPTVGGGEAGLGIVECPSDYLRIGGDRYCGARLNPTTTSPNPTVNEPVIDYSTGPFTASFTTDSANNAIGFNLSYKQNLCGSLG